MNPLALVTGAGTGIGKAACLALLQRNNAILAVGRRAAVLEDLKKENPEKIFIVPADISTMEGREKVVKALPSSFQLKYVVHNAGVIQPVGSLASLSETSWRQIMAINVEAPLFLTQALIPKMPKGSRILHISSGAAHFPIIHWTAYCTSKAALYMIYQCLNLELKKLGIAVGSLRPGIVDTPMQHVIRNFSPEQFPDVKSFQDYQAQHQLVEPKKVGKFICQLLLDMPEEKFVEQEWDLKLH